MENIWRFDTTIKLERIKGMNAMFPVVGERGSQFEPVRVSVDV